MSGQEISEAAEPPVGKGAAAASPKDEALYDAGEYLVAGPENHAEWWEHLGDAHRDYAKLARLAVMQDDELRKAHANIDQLLAEVKRLGG